jgi:hypothetical protein
LGSLIILSTVSFSSKGCAEQKTKEKIQKMRKEILSMISRLFPKYIEKENKKAG